MLSPRDRDLLARAEPGVRIRQSHPRSDFLALVRCELLQRCLELGRLLPQRRQLCRVGLERPDRQRSACCSLLAVFERCRLRGDEVALAERRDKELGSIVGVLQRHKLNRLWQVHLGFPAQYFPVGLKRACCTVLQGLV